MPAPSDGLQALEGCEVCLWKSELVLGCRSIERVKENSKLQKCRTKEPS